MHLSVELAHLAVEIPVLTDEIAHPTVEIAHLAVEIPVLTDKLAHPTVENVHSLSLHRKTL